MRSGVIDRPRRSSVSEVLDLLSTVGQLLASSPEYAAVLPEVCAALVPALGDGCAIAVMGTAGLRILASAGECELDASPAIDERRPVVSGRNGAWTLDVPLLARSEVLGALRLRGAGRLPEKVRVLLASELGARIANTIDAAMLLAREHRVADTLQRAFLPERLPRTERCRCDAAYRPGASEAVIGGDWYDAFVLPDERFALSIGDVAGHGLQAAVVMGEVRIAVRAAAIAATRPSEALERANQILMTRNAPTMVTAAFGIYDPATSTFTYASAGHPAPILATPEGRARALPTEGIPLGISDRIRTRDWTFTLPGGSLLVFYTDGLIEYDRDIERGEALLRDAIADESHALSPNPARSLQARIFGDRENTDDVATLTLSVAPRLPDKFSYTASAIPMAAPLVRHALTTWLEGVRIGEERVYAVLTAVGEAVANAVEHAYPNASGLIFVTADRDPESLSIQIEDHGRWRPAQRREERGHGLPLMRALMDGVEIRSDHRSTSVRMRMALST